MKFVALVSNNSDNLKAFVARNADTYTFKAIDGRDINRHRDTIVAIDNLNDFSKNRECLVKRAGYLMHTDRKGVHGYILHNGEIKPCDFDTITKFDEQVNDRKVKFISDANLADLRRETATWLREAYKLGFHKFDVNSPVAWQLALDIMNGELQDTGYDFYSAGSVVATEKDHVFTCHDSNNHYLNRGESSVHNEDRLKWEYRTIPALETIRNWVQLQYYKLYDLEPDRQPEDASDFVDDSLNPEWLS